MQAPVCKYCEADEVENYERKIALGAIPPPEAQDGWANRCFCLQLTLRENNGPGAALALGPRRCADCRYNAMRHVKRQARSNRFDHLRFLARDNVGTRVTARTAVRNRRVAKGNQMACRCGRDPVEPTRNPVVTYCLCCGQVSVDPEHCQVRTSRNYDAYIRANAGIPGKLRILHNLTVNFPPLSTAGRDMTTRVDTNNNRK